MAIESFSEKKNLARVSAGLTGGPFNRNPLPPQPRQIVEGYPPEYAEKVMGAKIPQSTPIDTWVERRTNSSMK